MLQLKEQSRGLTGEGDKKRELIKICRDDKNTLNQMSHEY